jgi:ATP-dependent RNA circularization protein (DNA/RNA ligase family)
MTTLTIQAENSSIANEIMNYLKSFGEKIQVSKSDFEEISDEEQKELEKILKNSKDNEIVESSRKSYFI